MGTVGQLTPRSGTGAAQISEDANISMTIIKSLPQPLVTCSQRTGIKSLLSLAATRSLLILT